MVIVLPYVVDYVFYLVLDGAEGSLSLLSLSPDVLLRRPRACRSHQRLRYCCIAYTLLVVMPKLLIVGPSARLHHQQHIAVLGSDRVVVDAHHKIRNHFY